MADDELRIRQLAYRIWESEGRPEGQQQRHWDMALKIVTAERTSGEEVRLEDEEPRHDEPDMLEDDLPLEDDERGIDENRLPLDEAEAPELEDLAYQDAPAQDDVPVHDRMASDYAPPEGPSHPAQAPVTESPEGSAVVKRAEEEARRDEDTVTPTDATDTAQVPGKTARKTSGAKKTPGKTSGSKSTASSKSTTKASSRTTKPKTKPKG
ncbi:hypothetical protein GCM10027040_34220 [Halomonas shantousis]